MKKIYVLLVIIAIFMTACQPTPEENIIQSKNKDLVGEVIQANEEQNQDGMHEDKEIIEQQIEAIDKHLNMEFQPNERVRIVVDADVLIPTYDKIPMVRVQPENFSDEHLRIFINAVAGDNAVYFDEMSAVNKSKEEIEQVQLKLKAFLQNDNLSESMKAHIQNEISVLDEQYSYVKSKADEILFDGNLVPAENNSNYSTITSLKTYLGKATAARIQFFKSINKTSDSLSFSNINYGAAYNTFEPYEGADADKINMSYEECLGIAEELIKTLDGADTNLALYESSTGYSVGMYADYTKETSPQCYSFSFARRYNQVTVKPVNIFRQGNGVDYLNQVAPEMIRISIDNEGILSFDWTNYTKYLETVTEDVPLMDFESINGISEDYCRYKFSWVPQYDSVPDDATVTINIDQVELNLMMTPEKDNLDSYIMIPVWDYIGDISYDQEIITQEGYAKKGPQNVAVLTVNAIDGTIIDREQGY